jgi:hypothetical protein
MSVTLSSSGTVVPLMPRSQGFAAASKAWLSPLLADRRLTHGEKTLASRLFLYIDKNHFETTGQLLAYPGWERLGEETTLSKSSIDRSLKKFESVGAVKINRGGFDPKTGRRRPNQYLLTIPVQVPPMTPGQSTPNPDTRCQIQVSKPGVTSETILGEVIGEENIKKESKNLILERREERGRAREEGTQQALPSDNPFTSPSPSLNGGNRPAGILRPAAPGERPGPDDVLIEFDTAEAHLAERVMHRASGIRFARFGRAAGFYLTRAEWARVKAAGAVNG